MGKSASAAVAGGYRITPATIERPPLTLPLAPRYHLDQAMIDRLRDIERLDQDVRRLAHHPEAARRLMRESLARNAYGTASIEGNPLTLEEVSSLLEKGWTPDNVIEPDEREILHYARIVAGIDVHPVPRHVAEIDRLHALYFDGVLDDPGHLKTKPNFIGERATRTAVYIPTPPHDTEKELQALLDWVHDADEHPIVKASVFFHEFQSIHPYLDGNGRLGRLLVTLLLHHSGYDAVRYAIVDHAANQDRPAYYKALQDARRRGWDRTPWIRHHLHMLHEGYRFARDRVLLIEKVPHSLNERQVRIVEWFARTAWSEPRRAVKFADVHAAFPATPRRTLTNDLGILSAAGVLHKEGERKGTRYRYAADAA